MTEYHDTCYQCGRDLPAMYAAPVRCSTCAPGQDSTLLPRKVTDLELLRELLGLRPDTPAHATILWARRHLEAQRQMIDHLSDGGDCEGGA